MEARQSELEAEGHKVLIVPTGGAQPLGFAAHAVTFKEMIEQSEAVDDRLDWIFHTAGTGTALPGLIAAKLMINHPVRFRSIAICAYDEGGWMSPSVIVSRVKLIMKRLGVDPPPDDRIRVEIDVDQRFIGEDYAVPTAESIAAIRELTQTEGVFCWPRLHRKGLRRHARPCTHWACPARQQHRLLHTGDVGNLFESLKLSATWPPEYANGR